MARCSKIFVGLCLLGLLALSSLQPADAKASRGSRVKGKGAAIKRSKKSKKSIEADEIPFLETTRVRTGLDLKGQGVGFLRPLGSKLHKALVNSDVFKIIMENKLFEAVMGMVLWRIAAAWSKEPWAPKKARLLFTVYMMAYFGMLTYVRYSAIKQNDQRTVKVSLLPAALSSLVSAAKQMGQQNGVGMPDLGEGAPKLEKEMTVKEYDLEQVQSAFGRLTIYLVAMTIAHFKFKAVQPVMYWGLLGPFSLLRDPMFQVYILGMEETGVRERPFGPKEEPQPEGEGGAAEAVGDVQAEAKDDGPEPAVEVEGEDEDDQAGEGEDEENEVEDLRDDLLEEDEDNEGLEATGDDGELEDDGYAEADFDQREGSDEAPGPFSVEEQAEDVALQGDL